MSQARISIPQAEVEAFCRRNQIRRLLFFGSVLHDDFRTDSDVDVLVEFEPEAEIGFMALARMRREMTQLLGRSVDLVTASGLKPILRESVLASAEEIYAA